MAWKECHINSYQTSLPTRNFVMCKTCFCRPTCWCKLRRFGVKNSLQAAWIKLSITAVLSWSNLHYSKRNICRIFSDTRIWLLLSLCQSVDNGISKLANQYLFIAHSPIWLLKTWTLAQFLLYLLSFPFLSYVFPSSFPIFFSFLYFSFYFSFFYSCFSVSNFPCLYTGFNIN